MSEAEERNKRPRRCALQLSWMRDEGTRACSCVCADGGRIAIGLARGDLLVVGSGHGHDDQAHVETALQANRIRS